MEKYINHIDCQYLEERTQSDAPPIFTAEAIEMIRTYTYIYLIKLNDANNGRLLADETQETRESLHRIINSFIDTIIFGENDEVFDNEEVVEYQLRSNEYLSNELNLIPLLDQENMNITLDHLILN